MSTRVREQRTQMVTVGLGCTVFLCTLVWIATSPISLAI